MINWVSSEDEKKVRKVNYTNLCKIMDFVKSQNSKDEMVQYVCQIFDEYKELLSVEPILLKQALIN